MVIVFFRQVACSPGIGFEFADQVYAAAENKEARFAVGAHQLCLDTVDTAEDVLIDIRVDGDTCFAEELCDGLDARQGALIGGRVYQG